MECAVRVRLLISALVLTCCAVAPAWGSVRDCLQKAWTAKVDTTEEQLSFILSLLNEHPDQVTANLQYRRSLLELYSHVPGLKKVLGEDFAGLQIHGPRITSLRYLKSADSKIYNVGAIQAFKQARVEDLRAILLHGEPGSFLGALKQLKAQAVNGQGLHDAKGFQAQVDRLLKVAPYLFDGDGKAKFKNLSNDLPQIEGAILASTPEKLENFYGDFFGDHLDSLVNAAVEAKEGGRSVGLGEVPRQLGRIRKQMIEKDFQAAMRKIPRPPGDPGPAPTVQALSIETLPALVGMVTGCYGDDCSIQNGPFWSLLKRVKKHYIRLGDNPNSRPDGYALSFLAEESGRSVPYVISIQGPTLEKSDVEMVRRLVAHDYGVQEVAVADLKKHSNLYNTPAAKEGLMEGAKEKARFTLPQGWKALDQYMADHQPDAHNYVKAEYLENGYLVRLQHDERILAGEDGKQAIVVTTLDHARYQPVTNLKSTPALERAILGAQSIEGDKDGEMLIKVQASLGLSADQIEAAKPVIELTDTRGLTVAEYTKLKDVGLGFSLTDLLKYDLHTRAHSLRTLLSDSNGLQIFQEFRHNSDPRFREALEVAFTKHMPGLAKAIVDSKALSDDKARALLVAAKHALATAEMAPMVHFANLAKGTEFETYVMPMGRRFIRQLVNDTAIARQLGWALGSQVPSSKALAIRLVRDEDLARNHLAIRAYQSILRKGPKTKPHPRVDALNNRITRWIRDPGVDVSFKLPILKATHGSGTFDVFGELLQEVPHSQQEPLIKAFHATSDLLHFRRLAKDQGVLEDFAKYAKAESFEYQPIIRRGERKSFTMGSPEDEGERQVVLTRAFSAAQASVTQGMYQLLMKQDPSHFNKNAAGIKVSVFSPERINRPVEQVSWTDAHAYLVKLSEVTGRSYRLPSEAEREYLQRAGSKTQYFFGKSASDLPEYAYFESNSGSKTHPVAGLKPNNFGIYDIAGNVWEWCEDAHGDIPSGQTLMDPIGAAVQADSTRVIRGGSWRHDARYLRSSRRRWYHPELRYGDIGFRLLRAEP